jgi:methylmalonyl-CoA/ethylmalonyl-CoA epimerase
MAFAVNRIGQIARAVTDIERAERFYGEVLGLRKLYRFGDLTFFDCAGVRLLLEKTGPDGNAGKGSPLYFTCADIALGVAALTERGVAFTGPAHRIARMEDHDLWMAFFADPDGNILALMQEAPKGYSPGAS